VALVIFAAWNPLRGVIGAFLFGGAVAFQLQLQARGAAVSSYILDMLPYVLTLLVLLVWGRGRRYAMPEGLKAVFESVR
jgi:simple sugar transport system permease protein